jgi:hypothetical protein
MRNEIISNGLLMVHLHARRPLNFRKINTDPDDGPIFEPCENKRFFVIIGTVEAHASSLRRNILRKECMYSLVKEPEREKKRKTPSL